MTTGLDAIAQQKLLDDHRRHMQQLDQVSGQQKDRQLSDIQVGGQAT